MFLLEKIRTLFTIAYRNFLYHIIFWCLAMLLFSFLTGESIFLFNAFYFLPSASMYSKSIMVGVAFGVLFTVCDVFLNEKVLRVLPIKAILLFRTLLYFLFGICFLIIISTPMDFIWAGLADKEFDGLIPNNNNILYRFLVFFCLFIYLNMFLRSVAKVVGKGNFKNWLLGLLAKPREEERIFMFIDMQASTTIAEKLRHEKFSHLVQDVFNDMVVVDNYLGDIYQYLGDGAIISWDIKSGLKDNNFLKAFYAYSKVITKRKSYYERKYGLVPKFKAGLHVGKIMVLQVGRIRRDISYNGDTLNTTARIESMCGQYKQDLLMSGELYDLMQDHTEYNFKNIGDIKLKGKRKAVEIYQVKSKPNSKPTPKPKPNPKPKLKQKTESN